MDILELNYSKPKIKQSGCISSLKDVTFVQLVKMLEIYKVPTNIILVNDCVVTLDEIKEEMSSRGYEALNELKQKIVWT